MLRKQGKTWDGVPVPYLKAEDLDNATFDLFRKYAKRSGRMEEADLMDDNHGLLEKLRLYEGSYLKRAAAGKVCDRSVCKGWLLPRRYGFGISGRSARQSVPANHETDGLAVYQVHESHHYLRRHPTDRNIAYAP